MSLIESSILESVRGTRANSYFKSEFVLQKVSHAHILRLTNDCQFTEYLSVNIQCLPRCFLLVFNGLLKLANYFKPGFWLGLSRIRGPLKGISFWVLQPHIQCLLYYFDVNVPALGKHFGAGCCTSRETFTNRLLVFTLARGDGIAFGSACLSVCLYVYHLQVTILNWSSWNLTTW